MGDECHLGLRFKDINKTDKSALLDVAYDNWLSGMRKSHKLHITICNHHPSSTEKKIP
jgi:hypothetical protein